jgi:hypothetical protein
MSSWQLPAATSLSPQDRTNLCLSILFWRGALDAAMSMITRTKFVSDNSKVW